MTLNGNSIFKGLYNEICHNPLSIATTVDELKKYPFPLPVSQELIDRAANIIKNIAIIMPSLGSAFNYVGGAIHLRGYQQMLEDMLTNLRMAETLLDRVMEYHFRNCYGPY